MASRFVPALLLVAALALSPAARAAPLSGAALAAALRQGGYVLVLRHANAPMAAPDRAAADPGNRGLERQLDEAGKAEAAALGAGLRRLGIQVGDIYSSPTFRAQQTLRLAGLGPAKTVPQLDEGGQGMQAGVGAEQGAWLRAKAAEVPRAGTDILIVTHVPNLRAAFGDQANGAVPAEALVFHPDGRGGAELVARLKVEAWATL
ncbi:MAG TPA: histidine phosphatase family protein [Caulobacteraceae bacterium]|jgi:phosphohistidine phosphatase SixA|nr:histidine phosphatase family protein [Caulobacteraceae bacterium]